MSTWGILGCGTIANEMAATFQKMGHEIYGVANRTPEKAEKFADKYGVKHVFETYEEMLADENIDIIYVATPHSMHYENMKQAVNAGKHILCEKAITVNVAQLEEVLELAEEKGVVVREAMTISHMPLYKKLKERIKEGAIGNTKMVQVNFGSNKGYDSTQRFFALEAAGGALLDIGVYATAFARTFLSEMPNTILTTVEYLETGADEQSGIIMKNTKGEMVVMCLTLRAKQPKRGVVTGDKGYIEVYEYPRACKATITNTATGEVETVEEGKTEDALKYEVEALEAAIEGNLEEDCQIITKERPIDENLGSYEDVDEAVQKFSQGALEHVTLYSIMQDPMTSCGCFECICGIEPFSNGVVIANREYAGMTPLGMTFPEMASMTGGGVQTPGFMGHGKHFISSKKFMKAEGGIERIVWMPKELKEFVADRLNKTAKELYGIDNFTDMIGDETIAEDPETLVAFLTEKGHPALGLDPMM